MMLGPTYVGAPADSAELCGSNAFGCLHWDPDPLCVFAALSVGGVPLAPLRASPSAAAALGVSGGSDLPLPTDGSYLPRMGLTTHGWVFRLVFLTSVYQGGRGGRRK